MYSETDGGLVGWFDADRAECYGDTVWGDQLYWTAGGRWVLAEVKSRENPTYEPGVMPSSTKYTVHRFISSDAAETWLYVSNHDDAIRRHFGGVTEERGP